MLNIILNNVNLLNEILVPILAALGTAVATALTYGITQFTKWIATKTKNEKLNETIHRLEEIIQAAVKATNQQFVDQLKKDGKFNAEAQEQAFKRTLDKVNKLITKEIEDTLKDNVGDIKVYIETLIEQIVSLK